MSATTRHCTNCGEWYDARSPSCYICGGEEREQNYALKKAVETSRLNGALSEQMQVASAERNAESMLRAAKADTSGEAFGRVRPPVPGYGSLVEKIKNGLEERPDIIRYYGQRD